MKQLLFVLLAVLATAACTMGPNYHRPNVDVPAVHRTDASSAPSAVATLADREWWAMFGDDTLKALVEEALRDGYDVRLAAWRVEEARANAGVTHAQYFPAIQGDASYSRGRPSDFLTPFPGTTDLYTVNVGMAWEIDLWGRIRRANEAARARLLATEEARRGVMLSLVAEVAAGYFNLRTLDYELQIARENARAFEETHQLFEGRLRAGTASELETSSAAASLANTAAAIPDLERRIVEQENQLAFLLGREPGELPRGSALTEQPLPPSIPAGLPSQLLERRPDLREAEAALVAANAEVGVAMAERYPTLSLTGFFGGLAPEVSQLFSEGKRWSLGAGVFTPVFQGKRLKYRKEAAVARWEQAKVRYEQGVNNAFAEVSTALVAYGRLAEVERELAKAEAGFRDATDLANRRYRAGLSDYLDVLAAQRQVFPAQIALARARYARLNVLVQLYRALGGGWEAPEGTAAIPEALPVVAGR